MSVTVTLDIHKDVSKKGITWIIHPFIEGCEKEKNIFGSPRPFYKWTHSDSSQDINETLLKNISNAYALESAYVRGIGETLMKVEACFESKEDGEDFVVAKMNGARTPCRSTKEFNNLMKQYQL